MISPALDRSPVVSLRTKHGPAWIVASARDIAPEVRQRAFAGQCKDFRYYELVEETLGAQFEHRFLGVENSATGEVVIQPLFYTNQDLLTGIPEKLLSFVEKARRRWPRLLKLRMLMVGCASG